MREGWKYKKLKDVASLITDGDWIESRHQSESGIRLIQTGNVGNGIFKAKDDKPHYISEDTFLELGCTEIFRGDCLVSRLPEPVGRACIIPEVGCRMITAVDCTIIRFKDCVLPKLFVYYTRSKQYKREIDNSTTGTTRKRISRKNLESVSIPLLPVDEQNKIVAELDLLTGIIDKQKQQLKEFDNLAQSIFYDMFGNPQTDERGWNKKKLSSICVSISDGSHNPPKGGEKSDYLMLSSKNIKDGVLSLEEPRYLSKDEFSLENKRTNVKKGDILLTIVGTIGRCCLFDSSKNIVFQRSVAILKPNDTTNNLFLMYQMIMLRMVFENEAKGVAQKGIYLRQLGNIMVIVPPKRLQDSFAKKIQAIESQKESINRSIAESQKLFDYTMDKYFG